jgi:peptide/nickel transport system permease protein
VRRTVARRLWEGVIVVWIVATITFFLMHAAPGDPFTSISQSPSLGDEVRQRLLREFGYDRPLYEQYARYLWNLAQGNLGWSVSLQREVGPEILRAVGNTIVLTGTALLGMFAIGVAIAIVQVRRAGSATDHVLGGVSLAFYSAPEFWLAILFMLAFAYWIPIFPVAGMKTEVVYDYLSPLGQLWDRLLHLVLPALTIICVGAGGIARYQRAELLGVMPLDFVRTARAKGLSEWAVLTRHVLRNALIPTISMLGLSFSVLFGGAVLVETIFSWRGMGMLVTDAIGKRDYQLVTSAVIIGSIAVILGNLLAELLIARLVPHTRDEA